MKDKTKTTCIIVILFSPIILLMLIDDGLFGETTEEITKYIIFTLCIIWIILAVIGHFGYKLKQKKEGKK